MRRRPPPRRRRRSPGHGVGGGPPSGRPEHRRRSIRRRVSAPRVLGPHCSRLAAYSPGLTGKRRSPGPTPPGHRRGSGNTKPDGSPDAVEPRCASRPPAVAGGTSPAGSPRSTHPRRWPSTASWPRKPRRWPQWSPPAARPPDSEWHPFRPVSPVHRTGFSSRGNPGVSQRSSAVPQIDELRSTGFHRTCFCRPDRDAGVSGRWGEGRFLGRQVARAVLRVLLDNAASIERPCWWGRRSSLVDRTARSVAGLEVLPRGERLRPAVVAGPSRTALSGVGDAESVHLQKWGTEFSDLTLSLPGKDQDRDEEEPLRD